MSQLRKKTCARTALTQDMFLPKTLKFRRGVRGIDWVICMCCCCSWNVSRNMCWWMCLWLGSQPVRASGGNALTASRLPAWHQNRWMPLIVTVCNVFNSIIPCLSIQHLSHALTEAVCRKSARSSRDSSDCVYHSRRTSSSSCNNYDIRWLTIMFLVWNGSTFFAFFRVWDEKNTIILKSVC